MMRYIFQKGVYEILVWIKKHEKIQPSKLAEIIKTMSEKTLYKRLEELKKAGLVREEAGINELGRPVKLYQLTSVGKKILKKFEEVEKILESKD